jgi:hypothetical protein
MSTNTGHLFDPMALTRESSANMIWPVIFILPGS